jgi:glucosylceramidase
LTVRLPLCAAAVLFFLPLVSSAQTVRSVVTTADLSRAMAPEPDLAFAPASGASPLTIAVDDTQRFQIMDGFGASMTDGSAWLLHGLRPASRQQVMTRLFDPNKGIGLSFLRLPIGSTDLSRDHYSYDDLPAGQQDPKLQHFSVRHDEAYIFPTMREALKLNPAITVMATPWSPPAWMKTHPTMNGGAIRPDAEPVFAQYLTRSVQAFQHAGIPVRFLSIQNEPLYETKDYPGTLLQASQAKRIIGSYLGPDLRRAGLSTRILAYDHNWDHPEYPLEVLEDPSAAPFMAGSALHCYGGSADAQTGIHDRHPEKGIWMTECSGGTWNTESALLTTAHLLIDSTRNWAKAVVLWGVALDPAHNPHAGGCGTCRPLVTVAPTAVTYNGDFYVLGHASQFVPPGSTRIASNSPGRTSLETVAFESPTGTVALLVLNNQPQPAAFAVTWHGRAFHATLQPGALATYTWPTGPASTREE